MAFPITVKSPVGNDKLIFRNMVCREELGRLFEMRVSLLSLDFDIVLGDCLGKPLTIAAAFPDGVTRFYCGEVVEFRQTTKVYDKYFEYEAVLRPWLWYLTLTSDCRIFQQQTAVEIISLVLQDNGFTDVKKSLQRTCRTREYCVQYNETDFAFISRLLEEEGIYYYFTHADNHKLTLVLADSISSHESLPDGGTLPYHVKRLGFDEDHIHDWDSWLSSQTGKFVHTDYDFEKPSNALTATEPKTLVQGHASQEVFHYPGRYIVPADGVAYAKMRLTELQHDYSRARGETNSPLLTAGKLFKLDGYHREEQNREYLVTGSTQNLKQEIDLATGTQGTGNAEVGVTVQTEFHAIPSADQFRTHSTTPRPVVRGPHSAVVVGKAGEEIWTDKYGRVKVQFHWDRLGKKDENTTCWLRVAQIWAGKNWGGIYIPRIGQEVLVDFLDGDPDRPLVTGCVYNADNMPPYTLPDNATQSGIKSRSSKSGTAENFNELRFEDKKDAEEIYFHAEKNFNRVVENNDTLKVGYIKKDPGDQTVDIYNHRTTTLEQGNEKLQVKKGNRDVIVDTGNDTHAIKTGNRVVTIDTGNDTLTISKGDHTITISAGKSTMEAATSIELKVGDSVIKITPTEISLTANTVKIDGKSMAEVKAPKVSINGSATVEIQGGMVKIN